MRSPPKENNIDILIFNRVEHKKANRKKTCLYEISA